MKIIIALLLSITLYADIKQDMFNLYQNEKYEDVCEIGFTNLLSYTADEEFILLYGFACLNSDFVDRLATPIALLKSSKESRANASYFSVILMQKKLLFQALVDNYNLTDLKLPTTQYILSKIFDLYVKLGTHQPRQFYLFEDEKDNKLTYKLYLSKQDSQYNIVIEEYYDTINIRRHIYW